MFAQPWWLLAPALIAVPLLLVRRANRQGVAHHPQTNMLEGITEHGWIVWTVRASLLATIVLACAALARPQIQKTSEEQQMIQGRDMIVAFDWSDSMGKKFQGTLPTTNNTAGDPLEQRLGDSSSSPNTGSNESGSPQEIRRIDAAMAAIIAFAARRENSGNGDSVGVIAFDKRPTLCWPLDRDLKQVRRHGNFVPKGTGPLGLGQGTNFGTIDPGPIDLAAKHFREYGTSTSRVLILVTDGEDTLAPDVMARLERVIRDNRIKLYVVGVGETLANQEVDIIRLAERVGGGVFRVETADGLTKCFDEIDAVESSPVAQNAALTSEELFYFPFALALVAAVVWLTLEAVLFGK